MSQRKPRSFVELLSIESADRKGSIFKMLDRPGVPRQYWYPNAAISWYYVEPSLESISYTNHNTKMGLEPDATVYEKYMISFYWVSATITANG